MTAIKSTTLESIFAEQVKNFISPEDFVTGINGNGNSSDLLNDVKISKSTERQPQPALPDSMAER